MRLTFGDYKDKTSEWVFLKRPDFVHWALGRDASGPLAAAVAAFRKHAAALDAKSFVTKCRGCKAAATRGSYYANTTDGRWWCDDCDPYSQGASDGKLYTLRTFKGALQHVELTCKNRREDFRDIVKDMAEAKGAPKRVGEAQAVAFLS